MESLSLHFHLLWALCLILLVIVVWADITHAGK